MSLSSLSQVIGSTLGQTVCSLHNFFDFSTISRVGRDRVPVVYGVSSVDEESSFPRNGCLGTHLRVLRSIDKVYWTMRILVACGSSGIAWPELVTSGLKLCWSWSVDNRWISNLLVMDIAETEHLLVLSGLLGVGTHSWRSKEHLVKQDVVDPAWQLLRPPLAPGRGV